MTNLRHALLANMGRALLTKRYAHALAKKACDHPDDITTDEFNELHRLYADAVDHRGAPCDAGAERTKVAVTKGSELPVLVPRDRRSNGGRRKRAVESGTRIEHRGRKRIFVADGDGPDDVGSGEESVEGD